MIVVVLRQNILQVCAHDYRFNISFRFLLFSREQHFSMGSFVLKVDGVHLRRIIAAICAILFVISIVVIFRYGSHLVHAKPEASWIIIPICEDPGIQDLAMISGDVIAWRREGQIGFVYDLSTGDGVPLSMRPEDVDGHLVVCTSSDLTKTLVYNVSEGTNIYVTDGWASAIDGARVVWVRYNDIYMYDLIEHEETQITDSTASEGFPDISGDKIVYRKKESGVWSVCLYDLSKKTEMTIATDQNSNCFPAIDNDRVVWTNIENGRQDIYMYTISTKTILPICAKEGAYLPSISGDIVAWNDFRHSHQGLDSIYVYNITSGEETLIAQADLYTLFLYRHSVSRGRLVWEKSGNVYAGIPEAEILSEFSVEIDKGSYEKGESVLISGGVTFEIAAEDILLNITVLNRACNIVYTLYSGYVDVVEDQRLDFIDLNNGKPFEWETSENLGYFRIRVTIHMESPYFCSITEESEVFDVVIIVNVRPTFNDNAGSVLRTSPDMWTVQLPNGTIEEVSGPVTYNLTQVGDCSITSITWHGSEISPNIKPTVFLDSSTTWSPIINCKIYSLIIDPVFYDNSGESLVYPSSWSIRFPNETIRTVSFPVAYSQIQVGDYSIVSILWKGKEVLPDIAITTSLASDMLWSPNINCLLPTELSISLSSSTSYVGFNVEINGNLTCNDVGLSGTPILLSYSVTDGKTWDDLTLLKTASDGGYSAVWMPSVTGNYLVKATWSGNVTYPEANTIVNLAVTPFQDQHVFSVASNSTVSQLAFNSTSRELTFTVAGPTGTAGYVNVYIAKTLVDDITDIKVYLDGHNQNYTATSLDGSWLLYFIYLHSTHKITINLGYPSTPFIQTPLGKTMIYAIPITAIIVIILFILKKRYG